MRISESSQNGGGGIRSGENRLKAVFHGTPV
jgi:hypothetical protein